MKKLVSLVIVMALVLSLAVGAAAQEVAKDPASADNASITISNASKGETYKIYKLFDADISADGKSIIYSGTIPSELSAYFVADANNNITATDAAKNGDNLSEAAITAMTSWAEKATVAAETTSDGSVLVFTGLDYGYYVVTTTQGYTAISVDSTNRDANIVDKNGTVPSGLSKTVSPTTVSLGDTVTYTVKFKTANFDGNGKNAKRITSYTITDTLPEFLSNVNVTKIVVDEDGNSDTSNDQTDVTAQFNETNKNITISWVNNDASLYKNGATVILTYTATVNEKATIGENKNDVTVTWSDSNGPISGKNLTASATFKTFYFDLVKTDASNNIITGAKFELYDAQTNGTKINVVKVSDGVYRVALSNETGVEIEAGTAKIQGLGNGTYWLAETKAPEGYNPLTERKSMEIKDKDEPATVNGNAYEKDGLQVINQSGTVLPSTGGVGTTIFYALGGLMFVGALVLLVTNKRMKAE